MTKKPKKTVEVTSHNQQGGLTVGELNLGDTENRKPEGLPKWTAWVLFALTIIGVLVAVLSYLYGGEILVSDDETNSSGESYNVTSHNQTGGVTAGKVTINLQPGWRDLSKAPAEFKRELLQELTPHKGRRMVLTATMGDTEAVVFAEQLIAYLRSEGFNVKDKPNQAITHPPYKALVLGGVDEKSGDYNVYVGNQNNR